MTPFNAFHAQALTVTTSAGLDDETGIEALLPSWLTIYPAPADKVNLENAPGGRGICVTGLSSPLEPANAGKC